MQARVHKTAAKFRQTAEPLLAADPVRHTIMLTGAARADENAVRITLHDKGDLVGAVLRIPPYPLVVSAMPVEAADITAKAVHVICPELSGVSGPARASEAFAAAWTRLTDTSAHQTYANRLFELGELRPPAVAGQARLATENDLPLLTEWFELFMAETFHHAAGAAEPAGEQARRMLQPGSVSIFWDFEGTPVALACARGPISGMVRVAPVYTPPEHRGHGYASAATAAASQWALDQGADHVLLYTDIANPITNRIYPRIGYQPLEDSAEYTFG
jgi:predicted GNAT family acetyltransferase